MKGQHKFGFTFIEVLTVLGIIALATVGVMGLRDWAAGNARVAEAKSQIATIQAGAQQWRPRSGQFTDISMSALSEVAAVPASWGDGVGLNPWGGDIVIQVDSSDATRFQVLFTNINNSAEGQRLIRDFDELAQNTEFTLETFEVTFQG